ncbi:MAG: transcriptional repressor [Bacteroidota bacterium]
MADQTTEQITSLLKAHGIRKTQTRIEILDLFMRHDYALSGADIMSKIVMDIDRVTIYRSLMLFENRGILHKASEDGQGAKYALCRSSHPEDGDQHVHFTCIECQKTFCLEDVTVPKVKVVQGFLVERVDYTLHGTCSQCSTKSNLVPSN